MQNPPSSPPSRASPLVGVFLGAVVAGGAAWLSLAETGLPPAAVVAIAIFGSVAGWGAQNILLREHAAAASTALIVGFAGIAGAVALAFAVTSSPAPVATASASPADASIPTASGTPSTPPDAGSGVVEAPLSTQPLRIPDTSDSFVATASGDAATDISGLERIAGVSYEDPQRLSVRHLDYVAAPGGPREVTVTAFTGELALDLAEKEWEWFAAGNSGDLSTVPLVAGSVRCALHDQRDGTTRAECWRWDNRLAVMVAGLATESDSTDALPTAVEDLFTRIAESY